jgi:RHS repeat-associated protein
MTRTPKPDDWSDHYHLEYDPWNRLTRVLDADATTKVAEYAYDARNFRVLKKTYSGGQLDETRHFYYNNRWQCFEERVNPSADPDRQFVWGLRYIDDVALRDRDTTGDGTPDERLYALQDGNWNVTSLADPNTTIQERYRYSAYGASEVLTSTFDSRSASCHAWHRLFSAYESDVRTGLCHVRNRVLRPGLGWMQRDPLMTNHEANRYAYGGNAPTDSIDPSGTRWQISGTVSSVCHIAARWTSTKPHRPHRRGKLCDLECICPGGSTMMHGTMYHKSKVPCDLWPPAPLCWTWRWVPDYEGEACRRRITCEKVTPEGLTVTQEILVGLAILIALLDSPAPGPLDAVAVAILLAAGVITLDGGESVSHCSIT